MINVGVGYDDLLDVKVVLPDDSKDILDIVTRINDYSFARGFIADDRAIALQDAMRQLREDHPHPYYWAPFVLVGNVFY